MRAWTVVAVLFLFPASALAQQPEPQPRPAPPVFRGGVELLTVDVSVTDGDGAQVTDLGPPDFSLEIDGTARPVISAEYVRLVDPAAFVVGARSPAPKADPDRAFFSTNARAVGGGRSILLVIDQGNIRSGAARQVMRSAVQFVEALAPGDRIGVIAIPPPGPVVDFTTEHDKASEALLAIAGQKQPYAGRFNISLTEALATVDHSDGIRRTALIARECEWAATAADMIRCELEVQQEAGEMVMQVRQETGNTLRGLQQILASLAALDGPKSVILVSEGLVLEGLGSDVNPLGDLATDVRASLDVLLLDVPPFDATQQHRPSTPRLDRELQVQGLEALAAVTRGRVHRVPVSADAAFRRINRTLSGHYILGVEATPKDRDGKRHRVSVKSTRKGVTLVARRGFLADTSPAATTPTDAVTKALRAALPLADMPVRLATWTYKEPGSAKVRLLVSAEVERLADGPLDYTAGIAVADGSGKVVASGVEPRTLVGDPLDPTTAVYSTVVTLDPGRYLVRLAFADRAGRIASVDRQVDAWQMDGTDLALGDLVIGAAEKGDKRATLAPAVEARVRGGLAALLEVYGPGDRLAGVGGTLEIVRSEDDRPLLTTPLHALAGTAADARSLQAEVETGALPPGRYLARATVTEAGAPKGVFVRPFRVMSAGAATADAAAVPAGTEAAARTSGLTPDIRRTLTESLPPFDRQMLLDPTVLASVFTAAQAGRPAAVKAAIGEAQKGQLGPAALSALAAGDQMLAAFLKGLDLFAQAQVDRATQQLQMAMQMAPSFDPARLYLAACLAERQRYREAASLLQSVQPGLTPNSAASVLAGETWLRAGDVGLAIPSLEQAHAASASDERAARSLGLAYVIGQRTSDGLTLLSTHLQQHPSDQAALLAAIYGVYASHVPAARAEAIAEDRTRVTAWARAYAAANGPMTELVEAWRSYLAAAK